MIHPDDVRNLIWTNDYDLDDLVQKLQALPLPLGQLATMFLAAGHVPLARKLRDLGVQPERVVFQRGRARGTADVLGLWAREDHYRARTRLGAFGQVVMPSKVLDYLIDEDPAWPLHIDGIHAHQTPLIGVLRQQVDNNPDFARDQMRCLELLEHMGADPDAYSLYHSPISAAAQSRPMDISMRQYHGMDKPDREAVLLEHRSKMVDRVLQMGADITLNPHLALARLLTWHVHCHTADDLQRTPFPPEFRMLFDKGLPFDCPTNGPQHNNLFSIAVTVGAAGTVKALLDAGKNPAWRDERTGATLLTVAAEAGTGLAAQALSIIPHESLAGLVNLADAKGNTPLHRAVAAMNQEVVAYLLEAGANPNLPNAKGQLPLEAVKRTGMKAQRNLAGVASQLEAAGGMLVGENTDPTKMLWHACKALSPEMAGKWIGRGADVNTSDAQGKTALHLAVEGLTAVFSTANNKTSIASQARLLEVLLDAGASVDARDREGNTALHLAVKRFQPNSAKRLLQAGAPTDAINLAGQSPAHMYAFSGYGGEAEVKMAVGVVSALGEVGIDWMRPDPVSGRLPFETLRDMPEIASMIDQFQLERATVRPGQATRLNRL